jgi:hypothetical protein
LSLSHVGLLVECLELSRSLRGRESFAGVAAEEGKTGWSQCFKRAGCEIHLIDFCLAAELTKFVFDGT